MLGDSIHVSNGPTLHQIGAGNFVVVSSQKTVIAGAPIQSPEKVLK